MGKTVNMVANGRVRAVPEELVEEAQAQGWEIEAADAEASRLTAEGREERYGGVGGAVVSGLGGVVRGATLGLSDVAFKATGHAEDLAGYTEQAPTVAKIGEIGGAIATAIPTGGASLAARLPAGAVARLGTRLAKTADGAGLIAKGGRAVAGGAVEGAIVGAGQGVSELALSDDPLTIERAASVLSSNMLYGGATGGVIGGAAKAAEVGLSKAGRMLKERAAARQTLDAAGEAAPDLAGMDAKQLRAARAAEIEAIEAARVPERGKLADEIAAFRAETKEQKLWLATKGAKEREVREVGKISLQADRALDTVLRNPKRLAEQPKAALASLQQQEHALEQMIAKGDKIRTTFVGDETVTRAAALDAAPAALERNRALQARIRELAAEPKSTRLAAIDDAKEAIASGGGGRGRGAPEQMLQGSVFGAVTSLASPLGPLAPLVGARASQFVTEAVFGKVGKAINGATTRAQKAIGTFLDVASKGAQPGRVLATRVLSEVRFAEVAKTERRAKKAKKEAVSLAESYRTRAKEIREQTAYAPDGTVVMRPDARARMSARLAAFGALNPITADRLETTAARKLEFLAAKLPRRPDLAGVQTGPDTWQPSDLEMRTWARHVAAAEDPIGVVERLAHGSVTPEDAETFRAVYPELYADIQRQIIEQLPTLQKRLPYSRRLALSIFSGVAVDPALDPRILRILQGQFAREEGTAGGTQPPLAQPAFGSVRAEKGTPSQERQA